VTGRLQQNPPLSAPRHHPRVRPCVAVQRPADMLRAARQTRHFLKEQNSIGEGSESRECREDLRGRL